jgi:hypothetical protein
VPFFAACFESCACCYTLVALNDKPLLLAMSTRVHTSDGAVIEVARSALAHFGTFSVMAVDAPLEVPLTCAAMMLVFAWPALSGAEGAGGGGDDDESTRAWLRELCVADLVAVADAASYLQAHVLRTSAAAVLAEHLQRCTSVADAQRHFGVAAVADVADATRRDSWRYRNDRTMRYVRIIVGDNRFGNGINDVLPKMKNLS